MTTGEKIRHYRKQLGISQAELAKRAGIHILSIKKYETNKMQPQLPALLKLAEALTITVPQLLENKYYSSLKINNYIYNGECLCADDVLLRLSDEGRIALDWSDNNCYFIY